MEASMDCYKFYTSEFTNDFSGVFPTISCHDAPPAMLISEDYPIHLNPSQWVYEDSFSLPSQQQSYCEDLSMGEDTSLPSLIIPRTNIESERELSIFHLLKAYGEATEEGLFELADVILTRLCEMSDPTGTTMECLSHFLIQQRDHQYEYLKHESIKNYAMAFCAFYEITPYGRFAHFVANASIQESLPTDVEVVHIIDFDVGDGIQWPPLLAALCPHHSVRITCTDLEDDDRFRRMRERLVCFAQSMGFKVRVDQMKLEKLLLEKRRLRSSCANEREWLICNCMVGLPHMGMAEKTHKIQVEEFIRVAQELVVNNTRCGILTYGNTSSGLVPFSDDHLMHSHALFESLESHFQANLSLARTTMECLFVGTCVSSCYGWLDEIPIGSKFEGCRLSKQNLLEAKEMVGGGNYAVKVRGDGGNEMVLEWRGMPLVRVSAWR